MQHLSYIPSSGAHLTVSVILLTYNHGQFIAEAINSILMQEVRFPYEIIIVEDCSSDNTRDILIDFQKRHPNTIRLVLADKNQNDNTAWGRELLRARGQYVALLDGDDYWSSPHKLQCQVVFMEKHPECVISSHNVTTFYEDESRKPHNFNPDNQKEISTLEDLWRGCFIAGSSAMIRGGTIDNFPDWFYTLKWADWALYILLAHHGKIGYIADVMGAYRAHCWGLWSGLNEIEQLEEVVRFYENMNYNLGSRYDQVIRPQISKRLCSLALKWEEKGELPRARAYARKCILMLPFSTMIRAERIFKISLRLHSPRLCRLVEWLSRPIRNTSLGLRR